MKYIERLEQGWSESLSTIDVAKLLQKIAGGRKEVKLTGKSSVGEMESAEQKPANADSDVAADGVNSLADPDSDSFDFYLFRTESDGSKVRDERSFLTYHSTIEKLIAAVEKRNQEKDEPTFSAS